MYGPWLHKFAEVKSSSVDLFSRSKVCVFCVITVMQAQRSILIYVHLSCSVAINPESPRGFHCRCLCRRNSRREARASSTGLWPPVCWIVIPNSEDAAYTMQRIEGRSSFHWSPVTLSKTLTMRCLVDGQHQSIGMIGHLPPVRSLCT